MKYKKPELEKMTVEQLKEVIKENENSWESCATLSEICRMIIIRKVKK